MTYTIDEYVRDHKIRKEKYRVEGAVFFNGAIGLLVAGLVALYFGFSILAVALLVIGAIFYSSSIHSQLMKDVMTEQYHLAQFVAVQHALDVDTSRSELLKQAGPDKGPA